jgi:mutator protein MutT
MAATCLIPWRWNGWDSFTKALEDEEDVAIPKSGVSGEKGEALEGDIGRAPPQVEVSAALIFREGKLLIAQRFEDAHLGGLWEFPGGKREADETWEECLARELHEELGIETVVGELLECVTHEYPGRIVHLRFFRCQWSRHEPQTFGCAAFRWVTAAELKAYLFPEADERLLQRLLDEPGLWEE